MAYYLENWEFVFPRSMQPFGKVTVFDWRARGYNSADSDWLDKRDAMNAEMLDAFKAANAQKPIDAVLGYVSAHNTSPQTLQAMAQMGAAIFNCNYDDKLHMPGSIVGGRDTSPAGIAHAIDLSLTNAPESVIKYLVHGGLAIFCPMGAQPDIHKPQPGDFAYDVSFIGAKYGSRPRFIRALEQRGIHVDCFGKGWHNGPVSHADVTRIVSHSRINLGVSGIGYSRKLCCLKGRDTEVPMSGGLYLTQDHPDLHLLYKIGTEIETYLDTDDCAQKILALLADPHHADAIRQAGHRRALSSHTWESRWDRIFTLAGILSKSPG